MKLTTKIAALGIAAASVGTIAAWAAWTSGVDGTGEAKSTTHDAGAGDLVKVTPDPLDDLYPGAVTNAYVTIDNDNAYPIVVTKIYAGSSRLTTGGCVADTVRTEAKENASGIAQDGTTDTVIAAGGTATYQLVLRMHNNAADNCKSQTFVIGDDATDDGTDPGEDAVSTIDLHADVKSSASTIGNGW